MKLVFATHNPNKIKEIAPLLPENIELLSLSDIGCDEEIMETADSIRGNALLKASYVRKNYGLNCFSDDTGLEVDALGGAPGVYSARYAGPQKNDADNVRKLLKNLKGISHREARFKTVIALALDQRQKTFTGICKGKILTKAKGSAGFGYDPIFQPEDSTLSFAEMPKDQKNAISHRGKALVKLLAYLREYRTGISPGEAL